mmetsp:Transcript_32163/g.99333  ORF Transcript_32163/g.99333 Transcript_32163/m.99333 type:complete len:90 (+) Transcript_32163:2400-2669(+)
MGVSMRSAKLVTLLALLSFACLRLSTITGFQQQNHLLQRQSVMARYLTLKPECATWTSLGLLHVAHSTLLWQMSRYLRTQVKPSVSQEH